jgi:hypothetical protein
MRPYHMLLLNRRVFALAQLNLFFLLPLACGVREGAQIANVQLPSVHYVNSCARCISTVRAQI